MSENEKYQGWTNQETWAFMLHVNNDQGLQQDALTAANEYMSEEHYEGTAWNDISSTDIGERVVEFFHDLIFNWSDEYGDTLPSGLVMFRDEVGSWWRVDPTEVGDAMREAVAELEES